MRSIPALYNGQPFSSRLECRWATWWDLLGIPWAYEPEVLELAGEPTITYVPDFWMPTMRCWVEIKGEVIDDTAGLLIIEKCRRVAMQSDRPIILCFSDPLDTKCAVFRQDRMHTDALWTSCLHCGAVAIKIRRTEGPLVWCPQELRHEKVGLSLPEQRQRSRFLYAAALSARQARFGWPRKKSA
jgi:hypothetical protein